MKRTYSWPHDHWNWPVELTHHHGVRAGDFIFTGGQADLDPQGNVQHPDDLVAQIESVFDYAVRILHDLDADVEDLVRLVVYYVGDEEAEKQITRQLGDAIDSRAKPVINTIPMPQLCYPGMVLELEAVAMKAEDNRHLPKQFFTLESLAPIPEAFSHVLRCGDVIFTGDLSAVSADGTVTTPNNIINQTSLMMDNLCTTLAAAGADCEDVLKLNVFYVGDGTAENWQRPAMIRQRYFKDPGPAATGITVPGFSQPGLMTKIAVTAMRSTDKHDRLYKEYSWPDGHWNWTSKLPYKHGNKCGNLIHLGGQVSLDSNATVLHRGDMVKQTQTAMENIQKVLAEFGASLDDVVKVTTFYQGDAGAETLHRNLVVRSNSYTEPGPATTGIPVNSLVYEDMLIEIEVIAVVASNSHNVKR